jgi:hypothetical protein
MPQSGTCSHFHIVQHGLGNLRNGWYHYSTALSSTHAVLHYAMRPKRDGVISRSPATRDRSVAINPAQVLHADRAM